MQEKFYITIGRQKGSGGRRIGEKLAEDLKIPFYDKEVIQIASRKTGLGKELFEKADEQTTHSLLGGLLGLRSAYVNEVNLNNYFYNETLFQIQSDVIRELAAKGPGIFVGRCADYVLKNLPSCLNVFIYAEIGDRLARIMDETGLSEKEARELIEKTDKRRSGYYGYYSNKDWGKAESYHCCINSSFLGTEKTADLIRRMAEEKFGL